MLYSWWLMCLEGLISAYWVSFIKPWNNTFIWEAFLQICLKSNLNGCSKKKQHLSPWAESLKSNFWFIENVLSSTFQNLTIFLWPRRLNRKLQRILSIFSVFLSDTFTHEFPHYLRPTSSKTAERVKCFCWLWKNAFSS